MGSRSIGNVFSLTILLAAFCATMLIACNKSSSGPNGAPTPPPPRPGQFAPPEVFQGAGEYTASQLDPYVALNEFGTWEMIGPDKFFIPSTDSLRGYQNWQPYQNGYWSFDQELGWSFVSQDRWGWMTEHYGLWRHNQKHGWVWLPFPDHHYEASVVTWFDQDDYVGWYPFSERFSKYYHSGYGFDDGYWGGYKSVLSLGVAGNGLFLGITLVNRADVTQPNIYRHIIRDQNLVTRIAIGAHSEERIRQGFVGPHPGGDRARSFAFIQDHAKIQAPVGHTQSVESKGGAKIMQPFIPKEGHPAIADKFKEQKGNSRPVVRSETPPTPQAPIANTHTQSVGPKPEVARPEATPDTHERSQTTSRPETRSENVEPKPSIADPPKPSIADSQNGLNSIRVRNNSERH